MPQIHIETIVSSPFEQNCFVVNLSDRNDCLIVDPGFEPQKIINFCEKQGWTPSAVLITHAHIDHIAGLNAITQKWPDVQTMLGENEADKLTNPNANLSAQYGTPLVCPQANETLSDGQTFTAAGIEIEVREIPGHSRGHVVYVIRATDPITVLVGDVIFAGSVGRSDFPDGDEKALYQGIREKLYSLPDDTTLYPGHGPSTTVGREKRSNPFVPGV